MGALEPACRLQHYSDGLAGLERPVVANQRPEGFSINEFGDEVNGALVFAELVDRRDVMV